MVSFNDDMKHLRRNSGRSLKKLGTTADKDIPGSLHVSRQGSEHVQAETSVKTSPSSLLALHTRTKPPGLKPEGFLVSPVAPIACDSPFLRAFGHRPLAARSKWPRPAVPRLESKRAGRGAVCPLWELYRPPKSRNSKLHGWSNINATRRQAKTAMRHAEASRS